ncbi:DUF4442 domain-containing protein [Mangrovitalea sediminis]|uniref:DUF4442 domain-containing protein n=1 Tax=Mangrovitalea sediminis TaxID=1982043 RepID=UPI000BE5E0A2|nr:DUF4442 domain-containing protein [Mangrovitalea sediminis]
MSQDNKLNRIVSKINLLPSPARTRALSLFFGKMVPFTGTAGIRIEALTDQRCVISLANRRRVRNHIGSVHAVASLLIAESATGFLVGMNVPDDRVPVIKTIKADFVKRAGGDMRVTATLSDEQVRLIRETEKGETPVQVEIQDGDGREPILIEMIWAWTPKRRS